MTDQKKASELAAEGFVHWENAELELAAEKLEQAIALADPASGEVADYHGQLAGVYAQAGQDDKARLHYENAVSAELAHGATEGSIAVIINRYFLAVHLLQTGAPGPALDVLQPSLQAAPHDWLTCTAHAYALHALGRFAEAKEAGESAIRNAPSPEKAAELRRNLTAALAG